MKTDSTQHPIDLVYLWVNGNDPVWRAKRNGAIGKTDETSSVNCEGRYADHDELKYSLRSIAMYAPWINHVYIVTDNQVPEWLDTSNPKVSIVDHKDILPPEALPCFNSSVIEHFICRIPGLSERFIYANDDMYLNRAATPETFFSAEGLPYVRVNRRPLRKLQLLIREKVFGKELSRYNQVVQNAARLVEEKFGKYYSEKAHHNIDAYLKSDSIRTQEIFAQALNPTFVNHERTHHDIQRSLYSYAAMARGRAVTRYVSQRESLRVHIQNPRHYDKLADYNPLFFCMNDSEYARESDRERAARFLQERFPDKSEFEK